MSFASVELLFRIMTERRWEIIRAMAGAGPMALRELARRLDRDVKTVHGDAHALIDAGALAIHPPGVHGWDALAEVHQAMHQNRHTGTHAVRVGAAPALDGSKSGLWKFNANLDVAINRQLSLTVGVIDTYNTEPPEGAVKNDVSVFTVLRSGGVRLVEQEASGGGRPISVAVHGDLVYVLNAGDPNNISGFRLTTAGE